MLKFNVVKSICLTTLLALPMSSVMAMEEQPIYGSQLMTQEERQTHQTNMRAAETPEARELVRQQHHEKMKLRAKEKGIDLPDSPPVKQGNMNQQNRPGTGMGPGGNRD